MTMQIDQTVDQIDFFETAAMFDFLEVPMLLVDTDPEQALARQKEMMDTVFDGIGEESKEEKRMGLAMQQLDIEQRHALRLLLCYDDAAELTAHLKRCLAEPAYGYGERGDNGRTIAQALADLAEGEIDEVALAWFQAHQEFQQQVFGGQAFSFRSFFDYADLDTFIPVVQRIGETTWRLGMAGEGKHRDFEGPVAEIWPQLCDRYVEWSEADNQAWLEQLKREATRLPDTIERAAWADRLRKDTGLIRVEANSITLVKERKEHDWPQFIVLGDQIGLTRLSGHAFYELAWGGGLFMRRFELSNTTRNKIPFEHTEIALHLAEALGVEDGYRPEPATPEEVEAAYLRRMKAAGADVGPPVLTSLPEAITGKPAASYQVSEIRVTLLDGTENFAYVTAGSSEDGIVLQRDERREVMVALPVKRGRPGRGAPLMTTPLAGLDRSWNRAVCAWGAWLGFVTRRT